MSLGLNSAGNWSTDFCCLFNPCLTLTGVSLPSSTVAKRSSIDLMSAELMLFALSNNFLTSIHVFGGRQFVLQ